MFKIAVVLFVLFSAAPSYAQEAPIVETEEKIPDAYAWDFGRAKEGVILEHKFIFKNEGSKILNINHVNSSCGCIVPKLKKNTLKSQESTDIEVKFDTKGYSGPVKKYIYVNTDNIEEPVVKFIIKADIIKKK